MELVDPRDTAKAKALMAELEADDPAGGWQASADDLRILDEVFRMDSRTGQARADALNAGRLLADDMTIAGLDSRSLRTFLDALEGQHPFTVALWPAWQSLRADLGQLAVELRAGLKQPAAPPAVACAAPTANAGAAAAGNGKTWKDVQGKLLAMMQDNEPYTSIPKLAKRLYCSRSTVHKAIRQSAALREWKPRSVMKSPKERRLTAVDLDSTPTDTPAAAQAAAENERADNMIAYLLQDADPHERARLNAMSPDEKRELARKAYEGER